MTAKKSKPGEGDSANLQRQHRYHQRKKTQAASRLMIDVGPELRQRITAAAHQRSMGFQDTVILLLKNAASGLSRETPDQQFGCWLDMSAAGALADIMSINGMTRAQALDWALKVCAPATEPEGNPAAPEIQTRKTAWQKLAGWVGYYFRHQ